jgi:L-2-hydroxyglutarate oxidase LhgO
MMMSEIRTSARKLKATLVLDAQPLASLKIAELVGARTLLTIEVGGRHLKADLNTKSLRRALMTLAEHGPDAVTLVIQGVLTAGDRLDEAGLAAQVRAKAEAVAE